MVICLVRGADLRMAQLMPLPLTVSCFSKIQIGFTFLVLAHPGSPRKGPLNGCVCVSSKLSIFVMVDVVLLAQTCKHYFVYRQVSRCSVNWMLLVKFVCYHFPQV